MAQRPSARIGINGPSDHEVFSAVSDLLRDRGHDVTFFDPTTTVDRETLRGLDVLVNKRTRPGSVKTLIRAERLSIPTWNSATGILVCVSRYTALCALEGIGFAVPTVLDGPTQADYVAKSLFHWGPPPTINGDGEIYEELLDVEPIDHKYYLVDTCDTVHVTVVRTTSKLFAGEKLVLGTEGPEPAVVDRLKRLLTLLEMRAIGVDFIETTDGERYAVDLNPGPSFRGTGFETELADSIEACLDLHGHT